MSEAFPLRRIRACGADWVAVHHKLAHRTVLQICARHGIGPSPQASACHSGLMGGHWVEISAHRGGAEDAPLASWEAYVTCVDTSAEYVELDIRRTADDVLVAHHDAWVEAPGRPLVRDLAYRQLCRMAGCRVPLVSELLEVIAGHARGHLDLKETGYERRVLDLATGILGAGGFLVSTPEEESARLIKDARPATPVALLLGRDLRRAPWRGRARVRYGEIRPLGRIRRSGADWVSMHHLIAASGVLNLCAREGLRTIVWTINGDRAIDRLLVDARVSVLVTDHPRHAARRRAALTPAGSVGSVGSVGGPSPSR